MKDRAGGGEIHTLEDGEGCCVMDEIMEELLQGRESAPHVDLHSPLAHQAGENNCLSTHPLVFPACWAQACLYV